MKLLEFENVENIVAKEEIAPMEQFLPLPQCFQMVSAAADVKTHHYEAMGYSNSRYSNNMTIQDRWSVNGECKDCRKLPAGAFCIPCILHLPTTCPRQFR